MIDISFLNDLPKSFTKECLLFRNFFLVYNDVKANIIYVKSILEIEGKCSENPDKGILAASKQFYSESTLDDLTNLIKIEQMYTNLFDQISTESFYNLNNAQFTKTFNEISENIGEFTKGSAENINAIIKDLNNAKLKFKTNLSKVEKVYKEIELNFSNKKKMEIENKNNYNATLKEKMDDKILNTLNEYDEMNLIKNQSFDECKRLEVVLNEILKSAFINIIKFVINSIRKYKILLENICMNKSNYIKKTIEESFYKCLNGIRNIELEIYNQEEKYNELKNLKNEFNIFSNIFADNDVKTIENLLEENFNKNNFLNSNLPDTLLSFISTFQLTITIRKKHLLAFSKFNSDLSKNLEAFYNNSTKMIKNLSLSKSHVINNSPFIVQICEFLRSLSELIVLKEDELNKLINSTLVIPSDLIIKDISNDESFFSNLFQKLNKEYTSFKTNVGKLAQNKEKISQNLEVIKENIHKTSDDVNSFAKYEKQFLSLRAEEGNLNESLKEAYKKFRKILEENLEAFKKSYLAYRSKETIKSKEFKNLIESVLNLKEKNYIQISEFLEYKNQIRIDEITIKKSLKNICLNFPKEIDLVIAEDTLTQIIDVLYNKDDSNKEIQKLIEEFVLINKEEVITQKEYDLNEFASKADLSYYTEKLVYLKNNSRKISIKNINSSKKMHEDIFYIDDDESIINSFACALSDKILLQGKLYISNKKLVFYSWFNNSTLFGKTLIEIPKEDIVEIERVNNMLFSNMVLFKTKDAQFLFASMINREKCYYLTREIYFNEANPNNLNNTIITNNELNNSFVSDDKIIQNNGITLKTSSTIEIQSNLINQKSKSEIGSPHNIKATIVENNTSPITNAQETLISAPSFIENPISNNLKLTQELLSKTDYFAKLSKFNKTQKDKFSIANKRNFIAVFVKDYKLGDIPLHFIYNSLYNPNVPCLEYGGKISFNEAFFESRQDYNVKLKKVEEENWINKIPSYLIEENLFKTFSSEDSLNTFIKEEIEEKTETNHIEYKYNYTHPILKKKFMGPTKLEVEDVYKIYFISPNTLLVEVFSYMSGFMMMDTFYSILQYKYETVPNYSEIEDRIIYETTLTISLSIEFVKDNWFKSKILAEAQIDIKDCIDNYVLPMINKVVNSNKTKYKEKCYNYKNKSLSSNRILIEESDIRVADLSHQFSFSKQEESKIETEEKIINNVGITNKEVIQESLPEINRIEEQSNDNYLPYIMQNLNLLVGFFILSLLLIMFVSFESTLIILLNLCGFYFIINKQRLIEDDIKEMKNMISKRNKE